MGPYAWQDCSLASTAAACVTPCTWDNQYRQCRVTLCSDLTGASECAQHGCVFESSLGFCRSANEAIPCERYFSSQLCNGQSGCRFSDTTASCHPARSGPPCAEFSGLPAASCPLDFCEHDAAAGLCLDRGANVPCERFSEGRVGMTGGPRLSCRGR
jgi:hypothetical protein